MYFPQTVTVSLVSPKGALQGLERDHYAPILHQQTKQPKLGSSQGQPLPTHISLIRGQVYQQTATTRWMFPFVRSGGASPTQQRLDPGRQFGHIAGQANVVISAQF